MEFERLNGTAALSALTPVGVTPLSGADAERVATASSPVAGSRYEERAGWLEGSVVAELTALNVWAHEP